MKVPEFALDLQWFNSEPLSVSEDLLGRVVVFDFWTFCCINCMHTLPILAKLERDYAGKPVLFIGVHSPKFSHEASPEAVEKAIQRLGVRHPVVSDPEMALWRALGVRAWPTLAIIGPDGCVEAMLAGESKASEVAQLIDRLLPAASGTAPEYGTIGKHEMPLRFPSKVALGRVPKPLARFSDCDGHLDGIAPRLRGKPWASSQSSQSAPSRREEPCSQEAWGHALDSGEEHLFIADTGHNQIAMATLEGEIVDRIGSGKPTLRDGSFEESALHAPQGVVYRANKLYIADTENHAIRVADLATRTLTTLAGTGIQGYDYKGGKKGCEQPLSSPWDVALIGHNLFIAMAGTHQIWLYDLQTGRATAYSGTGAELHLNSSHPKRTCWAQPSGLALGAGLLFVADSESSSIRQLNPSNGSSETLVGGDPTEPRDLFAYGDRDGTLCEARLQHPLGLCWWEQRQRLIVADSYNHKIKLVDPVSHSVESWLGGFSEPSGIAITQDGKRLFVANTNNHAIEIIDTTTLARRSCCASVETG